MFWNNRKKKNTESTLSNEVITGDGYGNVTEFDQDVIQANKQKLI